MATIAYAEEISPGVETLEERSSVLVIQNVPQRETERIPVSVTVVFDASYPARPSSVLFGALADPTLRLRKAIPLDLSVEDSAVVLTWGGIDEFGVGQSMGEALDDFGVALVELYHRLHEPVQLGPDLENVKRILDEYIESRTQR
jgi:hypothetical protein